MPSGTVTPAGGGASGTAGGDLTGTYPNPTLDLTKAHSWTGEVTVDTGATTGQALELTGTRTSENDVFRVDYPHSVFVIDSDGVASFTSNDGCEFDVVATGATHAGLSVVEPGNKQVNLSSLNGLSYNNGTDLTVQLGSTLFLLHINAAPVDGALVAGDCALWFDQTNGAAKLMVKGKTANGTVVAASVALA